MNASLTIFVTGATGATGSSTVRELLGRGVGCGPWHQLDSRSEQLSRLGAAIVEGDLLDFDDVRSALEGRRPQTVRESISKHKGMFAVPSTQSALS